MGEDMSGVYDIGDRVRLGNHSALGVAAFKNSSGADADPSAIVLIVKEADGVSTTYTFGGSPALLKETTGRYYRSGRHCSAGDVVLPAGWDRHRDGRRGGLVHRPGEQRSLMAVYRCECGFFLCDSDLKEGSVRVICRRCRRSTRVFFKPDHDPDKPRPPSHLQAAGIGS
jgi:hypothetical protein